MDGRSRCAFRAGVSYVSQDPLSSLNRSQTVGQAIEEPPIVHRHGHRVSRRARVLELLALVGAPADWPERCTHRFDRCVVASSGKTVE